MATLSPESQHGLMELSRRLGLPEDVVLDEAIAALHSQTLANSDDPDWGHFRNLIAALKTEPPCVRPGTGDHSWLRTTNPKPAAAAAWDAAWDEFERDQKALEERKAISKDTS